MRAIYVVRKRVSICLAVVAIVICSFVTQEAKDTGIAISESMNVPISMRQEYILNTRTKKIHKCTCGTAELIHEENRRYYEGEADALFDDGYSFCGNCFK